LNWVLEGGSDLVLQIHMQRTGKPEAVRPRIGFYFTDTPPARTPFVMGLVAQLIDIPPGATNYTVTRSFELPADVQLLAIMPHAHYLAREVVCRAIPAGGTPRELLRISRWDFNWQDLYRYRKPLALGRGTRIEFTIGYDNSAANVRNPHRPPRRVTYGPQSSDEMAEIWLQFMPEDTNDLATLRKLKSLTDARETAAFYRHFLESHPDDAPAHVGLGKALGPLGQSGEAARQFEAALALDAGQVEAHYYLGAIYFERRQLPEARREFHAELRLDPKCYKAEVGLGLICIEEQDLEQAERHLRAATLVNSEDAGVKEILARIVRARAGKLRPE
jgi:tetratricopeptide (TPR) repeat protein